MAGRWRVATAVAACWMLAACWLLTGCPSPADGEPEPTTAPTAQALPALPTGASTGLPAYNGPPPDAPPSLGPLLALRAAVDLTPATPGVFARAQWAVAAPDGGAHVVLTPADGDLPQQLVTVGGVSAGYSITGVVAMPRVVDVWGMHVLPDGAVVVVGDLEEGSSYGAVVVDPASGTARTTAVVPASDDRLSADGRSALSGSTLYLFLTVQTGSGQLERLAAVDLASDVAPTVRDLVSDVASASRFPISRQFGGLVPRPDGGVTLAFDASPTEDAVLRIPTLLRFDARLEPVGEPVRATDLAEGGEIQAISGGVDGTVFLLVEVRDATWLLAVPDGGGAGPVLAQLEDRIYDYALAVEPAQVWGLLPSPVGVRAVDLTTAEERGPLRLECGPNFDVRQVLTAPGGAVLLGECDDPREDTQMLWLLGP
ncbi:hypothetical protein [Blastococcus jejuensis]